MFTYSLALNEGVVLERVGDEVLAVVPGDRNVLKVSGEAAKFLLDVEAGKPVDSAHPLVQEFSNLGIIQPPKSVSRRGLVKAGAIGAGAGIAMLAMPSVAAAASGGGTLVLTLVEWYPPPAAGSGDFAVDFGVPLSFDLATVISDVTVEADDTPGTGFWAPNGVDGTKVIFAYFSGLALPPKSVTLVFEWEGTQYTVDYTPNP